MAAGFTYAIGAAMLNGVYSNTRYNNLSGIVSVLNPAGLSRTATFNSGESGLQYRVTPAVSLGTAYTYTQGGNTNHAKYHEGSVNVDYALSKRTDFYVIGVLQHASGTHSTGQAASASINGLSLSSTNQQATVRLALRQVLTD